MVLLSDVAATKKRRRFTQRTWNGTDIAYIAFMAVMHGLCLLAPVTFSWPMVALFAASYLVTGCLGITLSFHRQLSHKAFATPKWLEYAFAYCGVLAIQARGSLGFPISFAEGLHSGVCNVEEHSQAMHTARACRNCIWCPPILCCRAASLMLEQLSAGRPHGVGVQPPVPPPAHGHAARPALAVRGFLVESHGLAPRREGALALSGLNRTDSSSLR